MEPDLIALFISLLIIAVFFFTTLVTGSPPLASSAMAQATMFAALPGRLPGEGQGVIYELGSGWGGVAIGLADKYPKHKVVGFELSFVPWLYSRLKIAISASNNLTFRLASFYASDLADADLVVCYLMPRTMSRLSEKLDRELKPGALVLSNSFSLPGWQAVDDFVIHDAHLSHIYLYEKT